MRLFNEFGKAMKMAGKFFVTSCFFLSALTPTAHGASQEASPQPDGAAAQNVAAPAPASPVDALPQDSTSPEPPAAQASAEADSPKDFIRLSLSQEVFTYSPKNMVDPFVSFIAPANLIPTDEADFEDDSEAPSEEARPLTPLQKMSIAEIERGLRAITWGALGRRAVIEDSAGKGYIVTTGTPAGGKNSLISGIFKDHLVIQQQNWDRKAKRYIPQNTIVKLKKEQEK